MGVEIGQLGANLWTEVDNDNDDDKYETIYLQNLQ